MVAPYGRIAEDCACIVQSTHQLQQDLGLGQPTGLVLCLYGVVVMPRTAEVHWEARKLQNATFAALSWPGHLQQHRLCLVEAFLAHVDH